MPEEGPPMTATKYDSRGCEFQIEDPGAPGTWVDIAPTGINNHTIGHTSANADTTTYGSDGDYEQQIMQRGLTLKLAGFRLVDPDTGALDAGQALVETLGAAKSDDSVGTIRFAGPGAVNWTVWNATCELDDQGGGNNDKESWGASFTRSGASTTAVKS
jgi:hypothetical protein